MHVDQIKKQHVVQGAQGPGSGRGFSAATADWLYDGDSNPRETTIRKRATQITPPVASAASDLFLCQ
jgi:hypothetical protein